MRVLLLTNAILSGIAEIINQNQEVKEGWVDGLVNNLVKEYNINLTVCFPVHSENKRVKGQTNKYGFIGYYKPYSEEWQYTEHLKSEFTKILKDEECYDVIHIMGTEYGHTLALVRACKELGIEGKCVISIQGMPSVYATHFFADLPGNELKRKSFRDFLRNDNLIKRQKNFVIRGEYEKEVIRNVKHIIGRTDWDHAVTGYINPEAKYYHCCETLRDCFYSGAWSYDSCEKYTVFCSQGNYPIKGFHYVLDALKILKVKYSDIIVRVTGKDIVHCSLKEMLRFDNYTMYLRKKIIEYGLSENVEFLGRLSAEQMKSEYLRSNVFVSASSIENSPNSIGEAMILGTPVVTSDVGGVKNMLVHEEEGYVYQHNASYMLAYYIQKVFENPKLAVNMSNKAKEHAKITHNRVDNAKNLFGIYKKIESQGDTVYEDK